MRDVIIAAVLALAVTSSALAQDEHRPAPDTAAPAQEAGPLVLEPVRSPFVIAPDYTVTEVDGRAGQLAGGYAGRLIDEQLLIAGAIYKLANPSRRMDLTYGGLLIGWTTAPAHRVRFGARSLVGFGEGELPVSVPDYPASNDPRNTIRFGGHALRPPPVSFAQPATLAVRVRDTFAVLEPQGSVSTRLTDHVTVEFAAGYRMTAATELLRDRLDGVTGALALQLGW